MHHFEWFFKFLTMVFIIGWVGCLMTIPLAAYKFFSVLFDKDPGEASHQEFDARSPAKS